MDFGVLLTDQQVKDKEKLPVPKMEVGVDDRLHI